MKNSSSKRVVSSVRGQEHEVKSTRLKQWGQSILQTGPEAVVGLPFVRCHCGHPLVGLCVPNFEHVKVLKEIDWIRPNDILERRIDTGVQDPHHIPPVIFDIYPWVRCEL